MSSVRKFQPISVHDYLAGEQLARRKHEYVEGIVYAMAGGTNTHNRIATNAIGCLYSQLRGKHCEVFNSDTRVRIRLDGNTRFYYPDTMVVCQPNSAEHTFHDSPVVIVEVISEATRRVDEFEKRLAYLAIDTLSVYLLVEQDQAAVLVYRRKNADFEREVYQGLAAVIALQEIACQLPLTELYANVRFPTADQIRERQEAFGSE